MKASESGAGSSGWGFLGGGSGNANAKAMEDLKRTRRELESKLQENEELVMKMHEQKKVRLPVHNYLLLIFFLRSSCIFVGLECQRKKLK
tara:strand:- start:357 stop:626 length:270 start_codon:yes stop_codon:yes gene_type:complete